MCQSDGEAPVFARRKDGLHRQKNRETVDVPFLGSSLGKG